MSLVSFDYAAAYCIADPDTKQPTPAGRALAAALAAAEVGEAPGLVLPVLLASSKTAVIPDFSRGEQVSCCCGLAATGCGATADVLAMRVPVVLCTLSGRANKTA